MVVNTYLEHLETAESKHTAILNVTPFVHSGIVYKRFSLPPIAQQDTVGYNTTATTLPDDQDRYWAYKKVAGVIKT